MSPEQFNFILSYRVIRVVALLRKAMLYIDNQSLVSPVVNPLIEPVKEVIKLLSDATSRDVGTRYSVATLVLEEALERPPSGWHSANYGPLLGMAQAWLQGKNDHAIPVPQFRVAVRVPGRLSPENGGRSTSEEG